MRYLFMTILFILAGTASFANDKNETEEKGIPDYPHYSMIPDDYILLEENEKNPFLALGLSIIFPGMGQIYTGDMIHGAVHTAGTLICIFPTVDGIVNGGPESAAPFAIAYIGNMVLASIFAPIQANAVNERIKKKRAWLKSKGIDLGFYHKKGATGIQFSYNF